MNTITFSIGRELASKNIRCNNVSPGIIETPLVWNAYKDKGPEELQKIMAERHAQSPTGKMGDAWDIAHACVYFGSDEARYCNGVTMAVDGSFTQQVMPNEAGMPLLCPALDPLSMNFGKKLEGKVAIITGTDYCCAVAKLFAEHGASVLVVCDDADTIAAEVGDRCIAHSCDVTSVDAVEAMVNKCVEVYGGVDLVVNGPGIECSKTIDTLTSEEFGSVYRRNATSVLYILRFAIPKMEAKGGGAIVNMMSVAGSRYTKPECAVAAAAGSVHTITVQTAAEFAPKGIRCNGLVPFVLDGSKGLDGFRRDVAYTALHLCSDESRYISGQVINVDMSQASRVAVKM